MIEAENVKQQYINYLQKIIKEQSIDLMIIANQGGCLINI